jgi:leader peptidase (prepilin peptidase)/N-methyltransferase
MIIRPVLGELLHVAVAAWVLAVGGAIGSFLNVVIARVPEGASVASPGSRCPRCGTPIRWYDNVPVLSWILLRARCRACGGRISPRYPLVEALVAAAALAAYLRHGLSAAALAELVFVAFLVALAFIDLDTWLLPHALTWPLIALGLAASAAGLSGASLRGAAIGAVVGFGAFAAVSLGARWALKKDALGFGDVWLLAGLGAWLGVAALLPVVLLASVQGSLVGIALVLAGRAQLGLRAREPDRPSVPEPAPAPAPEPGSPPAPEGSPPAEEEAWTPPRNAVPFGPFLALGALEWLYLQGWLAEVVPALAPFR